MCLEYDYIFYSIEVEGHNSLIFVCESEIRALEEYIRSLKVQITEGEMSDQSKWLCALKGDKGGRDVKGRDIMISLNLAVDTFIDGCANYIFVLYKICNIYIF